MCIIVTSAHAYAPVITLCTARLAVRKYVFSNRVINSWNCPPAQCANCNTVDTFKGQNVLPSATVAECELTAVIMLVYSQPQTPTHGDKEAVLVLT